MPVRFRTTSLRFFALLPLLLGFSSANAQLKTPKEPLSPALTIKPSDVDYQLRESFLLVRKANDGDPRAQHELGLRYLTGRGFFPDTVKAIYWIEKAAAQGLPLANFNLGILYTNGWGVPWNPFEAFKHFRLATRGPMPEPLFALGLIYTENLAVPANMDSARSLLTRAAALGYEPAQSSLDEMRRRGVFSDSTKWATSKPPADSTHGPKPPPVFLDFAGDTLSRQSDPRQIDQIISQRGVPLQRMLGMDIDSTSGIDTTADALQMITFAANIGSPEARTFLGRCYETGTGYPQDVLLAAVEYLSALRVDSPRAYELLWDLVQQVGFEESLTSRAKTHDANAEYVTAGLISVRITPQLDDQQAVRLLESAVKQRHVESMLELGVRYSSGRGVARDRAKAYALWREAQHLGSGEARVRLAAAQILDQPTDPASHDDFAYLTEASTEGSVLAQAAIGYCYETGIVVAKNSAQAARYYRKAASRGSQGAYVSLRHMYDELRPDDPQFQIPE